MTTTTTTPRRVYTEIDKQQGLRRLTLVAGLLMGLVIGVALGSAAMNIMIYGQVPACM